MMIINWIQRECRIITSGFNTTKTKRTKSESRKWKSSSRISSRACRKISMIKNTNWTNSYWKLGNSSRCKTSSSKRTSTLQTNTIERGKMRANTSSSLTPALKCSTALHYHRTSSSTSTSPSSTTRACSFTASNDLYAFDARRPSQKNTENRFQ